jgi:hypothetical protein
VVECLPRKHQALTSNPSATKKKKEEEEEEEELSLLAKSAETFQFSVVT